jgi:putative transposase
MVQATLGRAQVLPGRVVRILAQDTASDGWRPGHEEQIIAILKEAEGGIAPDELCRRHGITRGSLYRWKAKYGGMEVSEARRLRQLEEENRQLKHAVAELLLDKRALQAVVTKKW